MRIFDIRRNDIVRLRPLTGEDQEKIVKFARRISKQSEMSHYAQQLVKSKARLRVEKSAQTQKVPTDYSVVRTNQDILVAIQNRYLDLVERKASHPLTSQFMD